jgi:hypothetical protein
MRRTSCKGAAHLGNRESFRNESRMAPPTDSLIVRGKEFTETGSRCYGEAIAIMWEPTTTREDRTAYRLTHFGARQPTRLLMIQSYFRNIWNGLTPVRRENHCRYKARDNPWNFLLMFTNPRGLSAPKFALNAVANTQVIERTALLDPLVEFRQSFEAAVFQMRNESDCG